VETYYAARQVSNSTRVAPWSPFLQQTSLESANVESQSLAAFIQEALVARTQAVDRGTTSQQFFVIAAVRHPAVLVEGGFLTNLDELNKLATGDYREQIAAAISDGVLRYREILQGQETALAVDLPGDK
jgi:N-acetylmuramoyl-L-alanine amidase